MRYMEERDLDPLMQWISEPSMRDFYLSTTEEEIERFSQICVSYGKYRAALTAYVIQDGKEIPVGVGALFLMPYRKLIHQSTGYVAVDPKWSGNGIGTSLVRNLKHLAKVQFRQELLHFELVEGSPIIPILEKAGFKRLYRQDGFFKIGESFKAREMYEAEL